MHEKALSILLKKEPSLSKIISNVKIKVSEEPRFPYAAMCAQSGRFYLIIGSHSFSKLRLYEKVSVLAHEYGHLILGHLDSRSLYNKDRFRAGIAHDMALNSLLRGSYRLPSSFIMPELLGLPANLSSPQYMGFLDNISTKDLKKKIFIPESTLDTSQIQSNKSLVRKIIYEIPRKVKEESL